MSNTSATGGYLLPSTTSGLPGSLTLDQFIQTVLVGISGIDGTLVRPRWQEAPPANPPLSTNWIAFGVALDAPDIYAYVGVNPDTSVSSQRQQGLEVQCCFYGPNAIDNATLVCDGFQIQQNLEALRAANMGFVETGQILHVPELVNERYINRYEMAVVLRREIQRTYPILSIVSATGTIHTVVGNEEYLLNWQSGGV